VIVATLPDDPLSLRDHLVDLGMGVGLDRVGVTTADPFPEVEAELRRRIDDGSKGRLTFTYNQPERSTDIRRSLPWAVSLIVAGRAYLPDAGSPQEGVRSGRIARFAVEDYYRPLRFALEQIEAALIETGNRAEILIDDNRLVDRAAAVRAGVGWWGKNSMVLAPGQGSWMLLGSVVTEAEVAPTDRMARDCGTCDACLPACPTGALTSPGFLDARLCLAAVLQTAGSIPEPLRSQVGDRLYGCDDCLQACPPGSRLLERSTAPRGRVDLVWILEASDDELLESFDRFYLPRRRPDILRRNALVAAGNVGDDTLIPVVESYTRHDDPVLAEHAAWALARLPETPTDDRPPTQDA
jgi:epoxyqueuosine reductase